MILKIKFFSKLNVLKNVTKRNFIVSRNVMHSSLGTVSKEPIPLNLSFVSYEDTNTHDISESTNASPLIVMHGLFGSKGNWNSLCKTIQQKSNPARKIIAVDARNHGDSPHDSTHTYDALAQDVKHLIETERLGNRVALMGHSMGGRAMMLFALKWPEMVDRLLIADVSPVSISPGYQKMTKFLNLMQQIKIPSNITMSKARQTADQYLARQITDKGIRQFLLTNLVQKADGSFSWRLNLSALLANYNYIGTFPQYGGEKRYMGPTIFISGGKSDYIQKSDHPEILKIFPKAEFVSIQDAGHWLHSEKPQEFLELVIEMLNRRQIPTAKAINK